MNLKRKLNYYRVKEKDNRRKGNFRNLKNLRRSKEKNKYINGLQASTKLAEIMKMTKEIRHRIFITYWLDYQIHPCLKLNFNEAKITSTGFQKTI